MSTRAGSTSPSTHRETARQIALKAACCSAGLGVLACALGRSGIRVSKREGDGATPFGRFGLREVYFNPGAISRPVCALPVRAIQASDGWCDAPGDRNYNRAVRHPYPASAERLWRDDGCTMSWSCSITICSHAAAAGAARFSCTSRGPAISRRKAASRSSAQICSRCLPASARRPRSSRPNKRRQIKRRQKRARQPKLPGPGGEHI